MINQDEESTLDLVRRSCGREEQCTQESYDDSSDKKNGKSLHKNRLFCAAARTFDIQTCCSIRRTSEFIN